ncbi:hypothetical protein Tco_0423829, partial [Tanacetum coccineum]
RSKGIMVDDAAVPSGGVRRQRPSSGPAPSFRDVSGDAIHTDFFPFFVGPYYATYPERDKEILRLKSTPSEFSSFFWGQFQGLIRKFLASDEFSKVQGELLSLDGAQERLFEASPLLLKLTMLLLTRFM